jgi:hypothetical protein
VAAAAVPASAAWRSNAASLLSCRAAKAALGWLLEEAPARPWRAGERPKRRQRGSDGNAEAKDEEGNDDAE